MADRVLAFRMQQLPLKRHLLHEIERGVSAPGMPMPTIAVIGLTAAGFTSGGTSTAACVRLFDDQQMDSIVTASSEETPGATRRDETSPDAVPLAELERRHIRRPDVEGENATYLLLADGLRSGPAGLLQSLLDAVVSFRGAATAGISLLDRDADGALINRLTALSGALAEFVNPIAAPDFSPCGACLDHDIPMLYSYPERRIASLGTRGIPCIEALVLPFEVHGRKAGSIWIVSHDDTHAFDMEDVRILTRLARFTGAVHGVIAREVPEDS